MLLKVSFVENIKRVELKDIFTRSPAVLMPYELNINSTDGVKIQLRVHDLSVPVNKFFKSFN